MKRGMLVIFAMAVSLVGMLFSIQGCATYKALSGPPEVPVQKVKVGEHRNNIITVLGIPKNTENKHDCKVDMYEFVDGHANGPKVRVIVYLAGDFFTLGLSELLFWPIELAVGDGTKGRAVVTYGLDDIAKAVVLNKEDGTPWFESKPDTITPPRNATSRVDTLTNSIVKD